MVYEIVYRDNDSHIVKESGVLGNWMMVKEEIFVPCVRLVKAVTILVFPKTSEVMLSYYLIGVAMFERLKIPRIDDFMEKLNNVRDRQTFYEAYRYLMDVGEVVEFRYW